MYYCSAEHQKSHWRHHKKLCAYLSSAAEEIGAKCFFGVSEDGLGDEKEAEEEKSRAQHWNTFRRNAVQTCEVLMGESLKSEQ